MSLTPETTTWNPNRYKGTEYVITYAADGTPSLTKKTADYTGVEYNFAELPKADTTTTTDATTTTTTTDTTQEQTTAAFGDVKPHWWTAQGEGKDTANVFQWNKKEPSTTDETWKSTVGFNYPQDVHQEQPGFFKRAKETISGFIPRPIKKTWEEKFKPFALQAIDAVSQIYRPDANQSFRGIGGLYNTEISLMQTYGSTGPTDMNPTGDPRKDDAGFNIVSFSGNYNKIGSYSRRHNMLKAADDITDPAEKKMARDKIRADWEEEKRTGIENTNYNIDSSGSTPKDTSKEISQKQTVSDSQKHHTGGNGGNQSTGSGGGWAGSGGRSDDSWSSSPF
jgi:hypothetical protein